MPGITTYRQLLANSRVTKTQRHRDTVSLVYDLPLSFLADSLSTPGSLSRYRTVLEWCGPVSPAVPPFLVPPPPGHFPTLLLIIRCFPISGLVGGGGEGGFGSAGDFLLVYALFNFNKRLATFGSWACARGTLDTSVPAGPPPAPRGEHRLSDFR